MIEAKGNFADMLDKPFLKESLGKDWVGQAKKQVKAAGNRRVEKYFHEKEAAEFAEAQFKANKLGAIGIHVLPYPGGVPNPNPRIRPTPKPKPRIK